MEEERLGTKAEVRPESAQVVGRKSRVSHTFSFSQIGVSYRDKSVCTRRLQRHGEDQQVIGASYSFHVLICLLYSG